MKELRNPHDAFFKQTLGKQENARSFLQNYLPPEILEIIDLERIEIEKDSFVTEELQEYFSDLLYKVNFQGREGYVYVLFEHKSYHEKWIGLQLLEYLLQCWKLKKEQNQPLPVVIPLVIYHGREKWSSSTRFADLLSYNDERLQKYIPDFEYILHDLPRYRDEDIHGIAQLKVMLQLLRYVRSPDIVNKLGQILNMLVREKDSSYLVAVTMYVLNTTEIPLANFMQIVHEKISTEGENVAMSTLQKLLDEKEREVQSTFQKLMDEKEREVQSTFQKLMDEKEKEVQKLIEKKEKEGRREGLLQGIETALEIKFGEQGLSLMDAIAKISEVDKLQKVRELLKKARNIDEFRHGLGR